MGNIQWGKGLENVFVSFLGFAAESHHHRSRFHSTSLHYYRPQTKLRKGNVFTSVCQEFCPQGEVHTLPPSWPDTPPGKHPLSKHPQADIPQADNPQADNPTLQADGYCSGRYASYWNAFLFIFVISSTI